MLTNKHLRPYLSVPEQLGYPVQPPYFSVMDGVLQDFRSFVLNKQMAELEEREKKGRGGGPVNYVAFELLPVSIM